MARKKGSSGGSETTRRAGLKQVGTAFTSEEHADLSAAAGISGKSMKEILHDAALEMSARIISEFQHKGKK
jgi:hypothetical protein